MRLIKLAFPTSNSQERITILTAGMPEDLKQRIREHHFDSPEEILTFAKNYTVSNTQAQLAEIKEMLSKFTHKPPDEPSTSSINAVHPSQNRNQRPPANREPRGHPNQPRNRNTYRQPNGPNPRYNDRPPQPRTNFNQPKPPRFNNFQQNRSNPRQNFQRNNAPRYPQPPPTNAYAYQPPQVNAYQPPHANAHQPADQSFQPYIPAFPYGHGPKTPPQTTRSPLRCQWCRLQGHTADACPSLVGHSKNE